MNKIILTLIFSIFCGFIYAQKTKPPRLVIGIMIDGLEQQQLQSLWNGFDYGGFKRMTGEGAYMSSVAYSQISAGNCADAASLLTGSVPYYHGITGEMFYSREKDKNIRIIADENQIELRSLQQVSARRLLASTVIDELKMTYRSAKAYSVGVDAGAAIMLGGHAANGVMWLDDVFMRWTSTAYYPEGLVKYAENMNTGGEFEKITSQVWNKSKYSYNYYRPDNLFNRRATDRQPNSTATILKTTPAANELVTQLALKIFEGEQLGLDDTPDMLMLQFTLHTPDDRLFSAEKEDMYFRLDAEIAALLKKIHEKVSKENTLVVMFGNQTAAHTPADLGENNVPAGYFNADRSVALLNSYLMAVYGQERWVTGYYGKNIFLNLEKIKEKQINLYEMQRTVAVFMHEFEGIRSAFPAEDIMLSNVDENGLFSLIRNSLHQKTAGDVIITLLPGWLEVDNNMNPVGASNTVRSFTPVYFLGWQTRIRSIDMPCNIIDIAPTLCWILNIPRPNACTGKVIKEVIER